MSPDELFGSFTSNRKQKLSQAISELIGPANTNTLENIVITSDNRHTARKLIGGLGLPSSTYQSASLMNLQRTIRSLSNKLDGLRELIAEHHPEIAHHDQAWNKVRDTIFARMYMAAPRDIGFVIGGMGIDDAAEGNPIPPTPQKTIELGGVRDLPSTPNKIEVKPLSKSELKGFTSDMIIRDDVVTETQHADTKEARANKAAQAVAMLMGALQEDAPKVAEIDESRVVELIKKHAVATRVEVTNARETKVVEGLHHNTLPKIIKMVAAGVNVMMVGPAGSGKTTIAEQVATALDLPFYFNGALSSEYKLSGFVDAKGAVVSTAFRKAYQDGGVYLFDEIDASMPDALLAFNAALANGHADFPDGAITRHKDFHCVAAANTFGRGADRVYVGRNQLDGASLDRFAVVDLDYDEKLERTVANNDDWTDYVQRVRSAVYKLKIRHVVSPRASIMGAKLLGAGLPKRDVREALIWKGLDKDTKNKIQGEM